MTTLPILRRSLLNLWQHQRAIIRILALPAFLALCCLGLILLFVKTQGLRHPAVLIPIVLIAGFHMLWVTVNLHRLFLLDESTGWRPPLHRRAMAGYAVMLLPITLVMLGVTLLLTLLAGQIVGHGTSFTTRLILGALLNTLVTAAALRLTSLLPAIALDRPMAGYRRRWQGMAPILLISALIVLGGMTVALVLPRIQPNPASITALPMLIVAAIPPLLWAALVMVFNVSLLSVLWSHYVEGRPLR